MSDVEFIQAERELWPTSSLASQIREIGVSEEPQWKPKKGKFHDVTQQEADLAEAFFPKIILAGLSLKSEYQSNAWGGILHRVVASKDYTKRCVMYLLTWTFQRGALSFWFAVAPPALLSFIALILLVSELPPVTLYVGAASIGFLFILAGLRPYLQAILSEKEKVLMIHNETWLILHGILFSSMVATEYMFYHLPAIPATPLILLALSLIILFLRLFQNKLRLATHEMDYEPVLLYLKKDCDRWTIEKIRFDRFHYIVRSADRQELLDKEYLQSNNQTETVKLVIDNNWHSMRLMKRDYSLISRISMFLFYIFLADFTLLSATTIIQGATVSLLGLLIGEAALVAEPILFWMTGLLYYAINPFELRDESFDPHHPKNQLTDSKLITLWNLKKESARLVFRLKSQDPFNPEEMFWNTFRDDPLSVLLFNVLPRLDSIEEALKKYLK